MICDPDRGKPQLFSAARHSEYALNIDRLAIMRHAYAEFHGVSLSLCAIAAKLRHSFFSKGSPPFLAILGVKGCYGQGLLRSGLLFFLERFCGISYGPQPICLRPPSP